MFFSVPEQTHITLGLEAISENTSVQASERKWQQRPSINPITLVILAHLRLTKVGEKPGLPLLL
jgi:hypothetical protein